uniref:Uncharacterized protein n=1 Tax=Anguilla anguilla TaxID=7936 RepID=A0A0E9SER1_ANGAN
MFGCFQAPLKGIFVFFSIKAFYVFGEAVWRYIKHFIVFQVNERDCFLSKDCIRATEYLAMVELQTF